MEKASLRVIMFMIGVACLVALFVRMANAQTVYGTWYNINGTPLMPTTTGTVSTATLPNCVEGDNTGPCHMSAPSAAPACPVPVHSSKPYRDAAEQNHINAGCSAHVPEGGQFYRHEWIQDCQASPQGWLSMQTTGLTHSGLQLKHPVPQQETGAIR